MPLSCAPPPLWAPHSQLCPEVGTLHWSQMWHLAKPNLGISEAQTHKTVWLFAVDEDFIRLGGRCGKKLLAALGSMGREKSDDNWLGRLSELSWALTHRSVGSDHRTEKLCLLKEDSLK